MRRSLHYTVTPEPDNEGRAYAGRVPVLPGWISEGSTKEEALKDAREALLGLLEGLRKAGEPVPEDRGPVKLATVTVWLRAEGAIVGRAVRRCHEPVGGADNDGVRISVGERRG